MREHRKVASLLTALAICCFNIMVKGQAPYDLYVSSSGSDANSGTSQESPLKSLSSLQMKAVTFGNGVRIKFLDQMHYRETLDLSMISNVEVDGGYSTFDAADIVSKNSGFWTQPDVALYPNVWKIIWAVSSDIREGYSMLINGAMPYLEDNIADVNLTSFSYYIPDAEQDGPSPIEVYINSTTNPNTDDKQYEIMKRYIGLSIGANGRASGIVSRTQINNDGSAAFGLNSNITRSLFAFGHKHNVFLQSGSMEDCIAFDGEFKPVAVPFVAYTVNPTGQEVHWKRCFSILPAVRQNLSSAFFGHGLNINDKYSTFSIEECIVVNHNGIGMPNAHSGIFKNNYSKNLGLDGSAIDITMERCLFNAIGDGTSSIEANVIVRNNAYYLPTGNFRPIFQVGKNESTINFEIRNISAFGPAPYRGAYFIADNHRANVKVYNSIFLVNGDNGRLTSGSTYQGDYNIFHGGNGFSWDNARFSKDGQGFNTLAEWQAVTGQDQNSVYLTSEQRTTFFMSNPATGDFRINPNAQVTASNGTIYTGTFPDGTPITLAGVQEHWNYESHSAVNLPPTVWPTPPISYAESVSYIKNPEAWKYYCNPLASNSCSILPHNFDSFKGALVGKNVILRWTNNDERNILNYAIERSLDGRNFTSIGGFAIENRRIVNYSFTDLEPMVGTNYYRLKTTTRQGTLRYSDVVVILNSNLISATVFPNPVNNKMNVVHAKASKAATIKILSNEGRVIKMFKVEEGAVQSSYALSDLLKGSYFVIYENDGKTAALKLVKQ